MEGGTKENDLGQHPLHLLGDSVADESMKYGFASWELKSAITHYLILRTDDDQLVVETFRIFKDDSDRSNYRVLERFRGAK